MPSQSNARTEPTVSDGQGNAIERGDTVRIEVQVLAVHPNTTRGDLVKVAGNGGTKMLVPAAAVQLVAGEDQASDEE